MKNPIQLIFVSLLAVGLLGCSQSPVADRFWVGHRPLGETHQAVRVASNPQDQPQPREGRLMDEAVGNLVLHQAQAAALLHHPDLAKFAYAVRVAEARALQAERWPNPEFQVEFENFGGSGDTSGVSALETTVALSQTFPLGGDITHRRRLAGLEGELAGWDYEAARIAVLTEVAQRFIKVAAAQRQVKLAHESVMLAQQVRDSIHRRVDAGDAPDVERLRAVMPLVAAKMNLYDADGNLAVARQRLASTWGSHTPNFTQVAAQFDDISPVPSTKELGALINQNPDVARWMTEVTARATQAKLVQAQAVPDLTASIGYRNDQESDGHSLVAGISIPLPVFDQRRGDLLEARLGHASSQQQRRAEQIRVQSALADAHARLTSAYRKAVTVRDEALRPATEAYQAIHRAFDQGELGFLDVLDAERTLIEFRQQYVDALAAYHIAVVQIEGLIGQPLGASRTPTGLESEHNANPVPRENHHDT